MNTRTSRRARVVLYISAYADITGCAKAALLLSQLHFWQLTMMKLVL